MAHPHQGVLVTGAGGQLGTDLVALLNGEVPDGGRPGGARPAVGAFGFDHHQLDVSKRDAVLSCVEALRPAVIIHAGAWTAVDACEGDPDRAFSINGFGTRHVAEAAERFGAHLVYISTDYVFDGTSSLPYRESDPVNPLSVYGRSKLAGERECPPGSTIIRTSWVCGAHGANMVKTVLRLAPGSGELRFVADQFGCPTFTADLAAMALRLGLDRRPGTFHVTNQGPTSWFEFVQAILATAGADPARVQPIATADLDPPRPAPRPANSVLDNSALRLTGLDLLPHWHDALERLVPVIEKKGLL